MNRPTGLCSMVKMTNREYCKAPGHLLPKTPNPSPTLEEHVCISHPDTMTDDGVDVETSLSFFLSLFMSTSLLRLFSRAHYWVNKYILNNACELQRVVLYFKKHPDTLCLRWNIKWCRSTCFLLRLLLPQNQGDIVSENFPTLFLWFQKHQHYNFLPRAILVWYSLPAVFQNTETLVQLMYYDRMGQNPYFWLSEKIRREVGKKIHQSCLVALIFCTKMCRELAVSQTMFFIPSRKMI